MHNARSRPEKLPQVAHRQHVQAQLQWQKRERPAVAVQCAKRRRAVVQCGRRSRPMRRAQTRSRPMRALQSSNAQSADAQSSNAGAAVVQCAKRRRAVVQCGRDRPVRDRRRHGRAQRDAMQKAPNADARAVVTSHARTADPSVPSNDFSLPTVSHAHAMSSCHHSMHAPVLSV